MKVTITASIELGNDAMQNVDEAVMLTEAYLTEYMVDFNNPASNEYREISMLDINGNIVGNLSVEVK